MTDVKLPEPAAFTTQIKEGRVIFMARVSLNTQGLVGIFTSDQLRQAVQEAVEAEREFHRRVLKRLHIGRDLYEETAAAIRGTTSQPAKEKT
jgi:hypothetical protein